MLFDLVCALGGQVGRFCVCGLGGVGLLYLSLVAIVYCCTGCVCWFAIIVLLL